MPSPGLIDPKRTKAQAQTPIKNYHPGFFSVDGPDRLRVKEAMLSGLEQCASSQEQKQLLEDFTGALSRCGSKKLLKATVEQDALLTDINATLLERFRGQDTKKPIMPSQLITHLPWFSRLCATLLFGVQIKHLKAEKQPPIILHKTAESLFTITTDLDITAIGETFENLAKTLLKETDTSDAADDDILSCLELAAKTGRTNFVSKWIENANSPYLASSRKKANRVGFNFSEKLCGALKDPDSNKHPALKACKDNAIQSRSRALTL